MLGERSDQRGLWEADRSYLDHVGRNTFYGLLASLRGRPFRDADFAAFYCADNGRDSVPPSLLATALLLHSHDKVSDAEAKARADFDLRWKVALGIEVEDRPFAKSILQVFRAQLILQDKVREVFESSLRLARESGYLKKRSMKVALDTTNILGRGAVRDTYNLLADGIVKLRRALSQVEGISVGEWAHVQGYGRYLASSIKGEAAIDWSDKGRAQRCWPGLWETRTGCWNCRGWRRGSCPRTALSGSRSWRRRNCWGSCCSRTWSVRAAMAMLMKGLARTGCCRCTTWRCAMVTRAAAGASTGTRRRL